MIALRTIIPNRIGIVDGDGESRIGLSTGHFDETRIETIVHGRARTGVATTSYTVSARVEVKCDSVTDSSGGGIWGED